MVDRVGYGLAKVHTEIFDSYLIIQSTLYQKEAAAASLEVLTEKLAKNCGYNSTSEFYSEEVKTVMYRFFEEKEYQSWNKFSKDRFKFEVIVRHCREGIPKYIEIIIDIISKCTEPDKDPELKFDMLNQLDFIVDYPQLGDTVRKYSNEIVKVV